MLNVAQRLRAWLLRGGNFECAFCSRKYRKLLFMGETGPIFSSGNIVGGGWRRCLCPGCRSTDRERLVHLYLKKQTNVYHSSKSTKVMHVGPSPRIAEVLLGVEGLEYNPCDGFKDGCPDNYPSQTQPVEMTSLPFSDSSFDIIICNHVLEHIPNDRQALGEIFRVLKSTGFAILQVPIDLGAAMTIEAPDLTDPTERSRRFGQRDHVRLYGRDYPSRLEDAGFRVELFDFTQDSSFKSASQYGLNPREILHVAFKPDPEEH